ncbi:PilW family protein [Candidatus Parabeggiatoa sp. HSG14]|uniref:PilW family protein n=1 Tax=Candidatus Parabeggiatoa sp. HSG14 TaxID=3055593 RepID=UPI0025A7C6E8|nr:PilW family protein [Thiotrichales bacterium HSG14]
MATSIVKSKPLAGFSLVEMMVALLISSILLMGVVTIMDNNKKSYILQNELAELQDNARFVMDELAREFRMAGYFGCSGQRPDNAPQARITPPIWGQNDVPISDRGGNNSLDEFPSSDIIEIASFSPQLDVDTTTVDANNIPTTLSANSIQPSDGAQVIVSDCTGSRIYSTMGSSPPALTLTGAAKLFNNPVEIFLAKGPAITVAHYEVKSIEGGFALFKCFDTGGDNRFCNDGDDDELLAEGVQNMQIRYGVDLGAGSLRYDATAPLVAKSIRVTLLMRTTKKRGIGPADDIDFQLDSSDSVTYNPRGDNETLEEGYRHRLFTSTIKVRNVFSF